MLLDCDGRPLRRAIGFERAWLVITESDHVAEEAIGSEKIYVADISDEKCDEPPEIE